MTILNVCIDSNFDWFSSLTLLATLVTALATLWTVKEVKKQRETSYHPELYLGNQSIFFYSLKYKETFLPFNYTIEKLDEHEDNLSNNYVSIDLHNVGLAVAKAIDYKWEFDIKTAIEQIDQVNRVGFFHIHYDKGLEISVPQIGYKNNHVVSNQLRQSNITYILPSSFQKPQTKINIPSSYIDLYLIFLCSSLNYYSGKEDKNEEVKTHDIDFENFPSLFLNLSYKDLNGKTHLKKFKLKFSFFRISSPESFKDKQREFCQVTLVSNEIK